MPVRVPLPGSERRLVPDARPIDTPDPNEIVQVTVMVRRKDAKLPAMTSAPLSREEFAARYGADPADVRQVEEFAARNDLTVLQVDLARRSVLLSGTIANMAEAFGTDLQNIRIFEFPGGVFRGRTGMLYVPEHLGDIITGVFGLDERPQARPRLRRHSERRATRAAGDTSYTPDAVAKLYQFPEGVTGAGQTVAIIELGGGFRIFDLNTYFKNLGIEPPAVIAVSVDGATNQPTGDPNGPDGEVMLDIEIVGAVAPGAKMVVYFAPNTDQGFLDAITTAVHDQLHKPSIISISWGAPETSWTMQSLTAYDDAFHEAGLLGVSVCVASGDDGSNDNVNDGKAHVDFPAASPHVIACGGTRLESTAGKIEKEVVWSGPNGATGGGVSENFKLPDYQQPAGVPPSVNPPRFKGRGVPDVAGDADPSTGYEIIVDGRSVVFGGTSAVAPLWAGLIARLNEKFGAPLGFVNPKLYELLNKPALRDITTGSNGAYKAGPGWDACTGLGSPAGETLAASLGGGA
jgi:kumamolisin